MTEHNIFEELRQLRRAMVKEVNGVRYYRIVDDFTQSSMAQIATEMEWECFRPFVPYKPESGRMLNGCYGCAFEGQSHTLMDYPTVVSGKLGGPWRKYNRLISLHVAGCPLHCWHCYVDECLVKACGRCVLEDADRCKKYGRGGRPNVRSKEIIEKFVEQGKKDKEKGEGVEANILRITGGEPFLVPDLLHECLEAIS